MSATLPLMKYYKKILVNDFVYLEVALNRENLDSYNLDVYGLKLFKQYEIKKDKFEKVSDFNQEVVYVAIPNRESDYISLYLISSRM